MAGRWESAANAADLSIKNEMGQSRRSVAAGSVRIARSAGVTQAVSAAIVSMRDAAA